MNCKPGDLAVIVRSGAGNEGKFVTCLRLATAAEVRSFQFNPANGPYWWLDRTLKSNWGMDVRLAEDFQLRPIRPGDISEEEVRDLFSPVKEEA